MAYGVLIADYLAGSEILRRSISGMSDEHLDAAPVPFKWSTRQVVLHIADFDLIEEKPKALNIGERAIPFHMMSVGAR
jgi:hypothetical protein